MSNNFDHNCDANLNYPTFSVTTPRQHQYSSALSPLPTQLEPFSSHGFMPTTTMQEDGNEKTPDNNSRIEYRKVQDNNKDNDSAFSNMEIPILPHPRIRAFSKRSRTGCLTCRERRIKCDENKPVCKNCHKSKRSCIYMDPADLKLARRKSSTNSVHAQKLPKSHSYPARTTTSDPRSTISTTSSNPISVPPQSYLQNQSKSAPILNEVRTRLQTQTQTQTQTQPQHRLSSSKSVLTGPYPVNSSYYDGVRNVYGYAPQVQLPTGYFQQQQQAHPPTMVQTAHTAEYFQRLEQQQQQQQQQQQEQQQQQHQYPQHYPQGSFQPTQMYPSAYSRVPNYRENTISSAAQHNYHSSDAPLSMQLNHHQPVYYDQAEIMYHQEGSQQTLTQTAALAPGSRYVTNNINTTSYYSPQGSHTLNGQIFDSSNYGKHHQG